MSDDNVKTLKLAEIKVRHEYAERGRDQPRGMELCGPVRAQLHQDRGDLLQVVDNLSARVAELEAKQDAVFRMSKCECGPEECCANLVALHKRVAEIEAQRGVLRDALLRVKETRAFLGAIAHGMMEDALRETAP